MSIGGAVNITTLSWQGDLINLNQVHCNGTEQRLADCVSDDKECLDPGAGVQCPVYDTASGMPEPV